MNIIIPRNNHNRMGETHDVVYLLACSSYLCKFMSSVIKYCVYNVIPMSKECRALHRIEHKDKSVVATVKRLMHCNVTI